MRNKKKWYFPDELLLVARWDPNKGRKHERTEPDWIVLGLGLGLVVCKAEYQGAGTLLSIFVPVPHQAVSTKRRPCRLQTADRIFF